MIFLLNTRGKKENKAIDALSRRNEDVEECICLAIISFPSLTWLVELKKCYNNSIELTEVFYKINNEHEVSKGYTV